MRLAENTGRKKVNKNRHLGTIAQLCWAISSQLRHVSIIGKELVKQQTSSTCPHNMVNLRPTNCWHRLTSLGHPCKFQLVLRLGSVTARHLVVGVSQTLRHWTEGATYIRQGDHHVGHWPIFLVFIYFIPTTTTTILWLPGWAGARRELLEFTVQGKVNRGRHTTIRLGTTPSGLTNAHLHHPPIIFTGWMPFLPPSQQCQSTEGWWNYWSSKREKETTSWK